MRSMEIQNVIQILYDFIYSLEEMDLDDNDLSEQSSIHKDIINIISELQDISLRYQEICKSHYLDNI